MPHDGHVPLSARSARAALRTRGAHAPARRDCGRQRSRTGGPRLATRRLGPDDRALIEAHFLSLGTSDRHSRFHACLGDAAIAAYVARIDFARMILVGALARGGRLIGLAEAHLDAAAAPRTAELAVSVLEDWRGRRIGPRLAAAAAALAFARGALRLDVHFDPANTALIRLAVRLGAHIDPACGCASLARTARPQP